MRDRLKHPAPVAGDIVNDPDSFWHGAEIVSATTRAQLIADGVLVDLTPICRAHGLRIPVAMTSTAWAVAMKEPRADGVPSDIDIGRLLFWVRSAIRMADPREDTIEAPFTRINGTVAGLKICCGPGDHREPVLTVMLPNED